MAFEGAKSVRLRYMSDFIDIIKGRRFLSLWTSQILSQLTVNILSFVILIRLYETTHSPIAASLIWISYALPSIIVGPFAAAAVDMFDKRKVLMISNLLQALTVLAYGLVFQRKMVFFSYAVVFLFSFFNQFYVPAEAAGLAIYLRKRKLTQANSLFFITQQSALVLGFGLGGVFIEALGFRPTVFLASGFLFIAFLAVTALPSAKSANKLPSEFEARVGDFFKQIIEGYKFIRNTQTVLLPFVLLLGLQVVIAVIVTNLPFIASDLVMISVKSSGTAIVVPAGVGALIGTFTISKIFANGVKKRRLILSSLAVFAVDILAVSIFIPFVSISSVRILLSMVLFVIAGFCVVSILVPSITFLQEKTPKDLLGRVFGNFWFLTTIATVVPVLFSATVTEVLGIRVLMILVGALCLSGFFLATYKVKDL